MKRISRILGILMVVAMLLSLLPSFAAAEIPSYDTNDFNKLQHFLNLPSGIEGKTNGEAIYADYNQNDPSTWAGVAWTDSNPRKVKTIGTGFEWQRKLLTGTLDVSGFTELTTLVVRGNRISELIATEDNKLIDVEFVDNHTSNISYEYNGGHVDLSSDGNGYIGFYTRYNEDKEVRVIAGPEPKSGYVFHGWEWYGELTGEDGRLYLDIDEYTTHTSIASFMTLERPYYTVRFDLQGGEHMGGGELVQYISKYDSAELPETSMAGYNLNGWDEDYFEITSDRTITAIWEANGSTITPKPTRIPTPIPTVVPTPVPTVPPTPIPTVEPTPVIPTVAPTPVIPRIKYYQVTFDPNGGTRTSGGGLKQTIEGGFDAYPPIVEFENHKFVGWDASYQGISENITIKAIWKKLHQVTFDMNGGVKTGGGELSQIILDGEGATAPLVERSGYTFNGWHKAFDCIKEDTVIAALWERKPEEPVKEAPVPETFRVIYDINGGTGATPVDTNEYLEGDVALLTDGSGFNLEGCDFAGWSYEMEGTAITEEEITIDTDVTLYAVWVEAEETIAVPEPTTAPPVEEIEVVEEVTDIPKTGEASGIGISAVMLAFGGGIAFFEAIRRRKNTKTD